MKPLENRFSVLNFYALKVTIIVWRYFFFNSHKKSYKPTFLLSTPKYFEHINVSIQKSKLKHRMLSSRNTRCHHRCSHWIQYCMKQLGPLVYCISGQQFKFSDLSWLQKWFNKPLPLSTHHAVVHQPLQSYLIYVVSCG
jgi:hypothetical protein